MPVGGVGGPGAAGGPAGVDAASATSASGPGAPAALPALGSPRVKDDATLEAVAHGTRTLAFGARGEPVKAGQQALMDLGFPAPELGRGGGFGREPPSGG